MRCTYAIYAIMKCSDSMHRNTDTFYPINRFLMNFKSVTLSFVISAAMSSSLLITSFSASAAQKKPPRWFEIEVILFKQLGDKALLKEQFPDTVPHVAQQASFDLLSSYLQPDIDSLKQQLNTCIDTLSSLNQYDLIANASRVDFSPSVQAANAINGSVKAMFSTKTLVEIEELTSLDLSGSANQSTNSSATLNTEQDLPSSQTQASTVLSPLLSEVAVDNSSVAALKQETLTQEVLVGLTDNEVNLLALAEQQFSPIQWHDYAQFPYFNNKLCQIPQGYFQHHLTEEEFASFNFNSFPVEAMPKLISASGVRNSKKPYLIHQDSLRLKDITTRLKWSKNFKPLMHLGWRQIGVTRKKATPMKLFSGQHLQQSYTDELQAYEALLNAKVNHYQEATRLAEQSENTLFNSDSTLSNALVNEPAPLVEPTKTQQSNTVEASIAQQQINAILRQANDINTDDLTQIINELGLPSTVEAPKREQPNDLSFIDETTLTQSSIVKPQSPRQAWELDGLFKVHLDHYLYITADLSIQVPAIAQQNAPNSSAAPLQIKLNQNRRVISGEVHYFDHPYIGMIVQIRRFDPNKPDDEAVSQAIK